MTFFVVVLEQNRLIILEGKWIENPTIREISRVFYSPNPETPANFDLKQTYLLGKQKNCCYTGYIVKKFELISKAEKFKGLGKTGFPH